MVKFLRFVFIAFALVSGFAASAATYYDSKESCMTAGYAGKAVGYQPTVRHSKFGDARIAGFEKRPLEGDGCFVIGAAPGKRWVFLKQGTEVYTKGVAVQLLAECQNDIYEGEYLKKKATPVAPTASPVQATNVAIEHGSCTTNDCNTVTETQVINQVVVRHAICKDEVTGTTFAPVNGDCNFKPIQANTSMRATSSVTCSGCGKPTSVVPAPAPAGAPTAAANTGCPGMNCYATVIREEKAKVCGIAIQNSLEDKTISARLQLDVDPAYPGKIRIAKVKSFEGVAEQVAVSSLQSSSAGDCNVDQATVYQNWPAIIKKFNLPGDCIPKKL